MSCSANGSANKHDKMSWYLAALGVIAGANRIIMGIACRSEARAEASGASLALWCLMASKRRRKDGRGRQEEKGPVARGVPRMRFRASPASAVRFVDGTTGTGLGRSEKENRTALRALQGPGRDHTDPPNECD